MGKRSLIPGEKYKIKQAIREEIEKNGPISDKRKKEIAKQIHKKEKRKVMIGILAGAIGLAGIGVVGTKMLNQPEEPRTKQEENQQPGKGNNDFKEGYRVNEEDLKNFKSKYKEKSETEKLVDKLEDKEDVLNFLKDMYIEEYEKQTGDENLTTEDITITYNYENYVYVNDKTGEIITHGEQPLETEQALKKDGISYSIKDNVKVFKVKTKTGETIDCMTLGSKDGKSIPVKVALGEKYGQSKDSVLASIGTIIPDGIEYCENMKKDENSKAIAKQKFIKSLEEKNQQEQEIEDSEIGD